MIKNQRFWTNFLSLILVFSQVLHAETIAEGGQLVTQPKTVWNNLCNVNRLYNRFREGGGGGWRDVLNILRCRGGGVALRDFLNILRCRGGGVALRDFLNILRCRGGGVALKHPSMPWGGEGRAQTSCDAVGGITLRNFLNIQSCRGGGWGHRL